MNARCFLFLLLAPQDTSVHDELSTWIQGRAEKETDPPGYRVEWIHWNSTFGTTDLRIGDRIIGVNGKRNTETDVKHGTAVGAYQEHVKWKQEGRKEDDEIELLVYRDGTELRIKGALRAKRTYRNANNRRLMSPQGPEALQKDGFLYAWQQWYDEFVKHCARVLGLGWEGFSFQNRVLLEQHEAMKARVDYLMKNHKGPFAESIHSDWVRVHENLLGTKYDLTAEDLEYRVWAEKRAKIIKEAGEEARTKFIEKHKKGMIDAFPAVDPLKGDVSEVVGKIVELPQLTYRRNLTEDLGRTFLVSESGSGGHYFIDCNSPSMDRFYHAHDRYQDQVRPDVPENFRLIGIIQKEPKMLTFQRSLVTGLVLKVIAGSAGDDTYFVDLTSPKEGKPSSFAGEDLIKLNNPIRLTPESTPREIVEAMIAATKFADRKRWESLFANWQTTLLGAKRPPLYSPVAYHSPELLARAWERSRQVILKEVFDARVVKVGRVERIHTKNEGSPAPTIDRVNVTVDHVGQFDEEYRSFVDLKVHRMWILERRDGGPWKILSFQSL